MKNAKVLVTGGLGYIGSHTCVQMIEQGMQPIIWSCIQHVDHNI